MKKLLVLGMLLPFISHAQKIAVIDPQLKKPITYVPALKLSYLLQGYFVLQASDFAAVKQSVRQYRELIEKKKDIPEHLKSVINGSTYFTVSGSGNDYSIVLDTKIDKMGSYFVLTDKSKSRNKNLQSIDDFLAYLDKGN